MWTDTETHAGDERIICHKMKLESSLHLGYQQRKPHNLRELGIVVWKEQHNDWNEVKRNNLLLKMPWGLRKIFFYVLTFCNLNYIRRQ